MKMKFGIIGGDKRQLHLASSILEDGYEVYVCGFEMYEHSTEFKELSLLSIFRECDTIILPLPATKDGVNIFAPYSSKEIVVDDNFILSLRNKSVYGGYMSKLLVKNLLWEEIEVGDYYLREEFAIKNAVPTAEGALAVAINEYEGTINGAKCLVTGYGRIGKILTNYLLGIGAKVYVAARKTKDLAMIKAVGGVPIKYSDINGEFNIIFNTVPDTVIDSKVIAKLDKDSMIIELASLPGGVDRKAASLKNINVIDAQSLPGKVAPKASGEYVKETIYNMMEE